MSNTTIEPSDAVDNIHPEVKRSSEFSDRLSPMLVKELRQGLKGYGFVIIFIVLQIALALFILGSSFDKAYDDTGTNISNAIFFIVSMATLVAQPLRGSSAISSEIKENTIELMVMTRLSAWRIVFGKWISTVSQSALIISSVTPYIIVRYFFGGMQLFPELMVLISIFILSASLTAVTVGLSAIPSFIIRAIISVATAWLVIAGCVEVFDSGYDYRELLRLCGWDTSEYLGIYFTMFGCALYFGWLALDFGASYIAPIAENRATPRRIIALVLILLTILVFTFLDKDIREYLPPQILTILSIPVCIISLTELTTPLPTISASFMRRGIIARISRYLLYPGWQSGLWYTLLLYLITLSTTLWVLETSFSRTQMEFITVISISFSCVVFPLTLSKLFFRNRNHPFLFYVAAMIASAIIATVIITITQVTNDDNIAMWMCWNPPVQFYLFSTTVSYRPTNSIELVSIISIASLSANWLICFILSLPDIKKMKISEQRAKQMIEPSSSQ